MGRTENENKSHISDGIGLSFLIYDNWYDPALLPTVKSTGGFQ